LVFLPFDCETVDVLGIFIAKLGEIVLSLFLVFKPLRSLGHQIESLIVVDSQNVLECLPLLIKDIAESNGEKHYFLLGKGKCMNIIAINVRRKFSLSFKKQFKE